MQSSYFLYPIVLSLISALIFWLTFAYYPEQKRKKKIRPILEIDLFQIYATLSSIFDNIMRHAENSPSYYQNVIKSGALSLRDLKLGIQNKCLNANYLYDPEVKDKLIIIGKRIYDSSAHIDYLVNKIISFEQYASAAEILLLEEIRTELRKYDFENDAANSDPVINIMGSLLRPPVPIINYRIQNFFDLYNLFIKLQKLIMEQTNIINHNIFINKMQYLFNSKSYKKCKAFIDKNRVQFKKKEDLYNNYYALSEYMLGNEKIYYKCINNIYKNKPNLVSSRGFLQDVLNNKNIIQILTSYYKPEEIYDLQ